jgi:inhibitor of KinA
MILWSERLHLEPLGDQAVLATFADEAGAARFAAAIRQLDAPWLVDVVLAYVTVAVFFDLDQTNYETAAAALRQLRLPRSAEPGRLHLIPCCYERQRDLQRVAEHTGLNPEDVIRLHHSVEYTVYAIGFSPGFPYLGYLPEKLDGVPRLEKPRVRVEPGSVGIAGKQTGIYPSTTPGGWNLIGQTPLELANLADGYFPMMAGDRVRFRRIDEVEFQQLQGQRLLMD